MSQQTVDERRDPDPAAGLRLGRRRAHGDGGDRDRRARVQAARVAQRRPDADGDGRDPRRSCSSGSRSSPAASTSCPIEEPKQTVISQIARHVYGDTLGLLPVPGVHGAAPVPRREHLLRRVPAPRPPCSPRTASSPRQFAFRGDRLAYSTGIMLLGTVAAPRRDRRRRLDARADPAVRGRRVHRLHDRAVGHGPALAARRGTQGWRRRLTINATGAVLTGVIAIVVTSVKFVAGAYLVVILIPTLVGAMLFIRRQYDGAGRGARWSATTWCSTGRTASSGS